MSLSIEHHGFTVTAVDSNWFIIESSDSPNVSRYLNLDQLDQWIEKLTAIRLAAKHVGVDKNGRNVNI